MFQENSIKICILSRVKQITSPGWMHETGAWGSCTGKTQRDRVEGEVVQGDRNGEFNSDDHIYYCGGQESLRRNGVAIIVNKRV